MGSKIRCLANSLPTENEGKHLSSRRFLQKSHPTVDYLLSDARLIFAANVVARDCSLNPRDGPRAIERDPLVRDKGD